MSAPPFLISYTKEAEQTLSDMKGKPQHKVKYNKVKKAIKYLKEIGPSYPGLHTHQMNVIKGPNGEALWNSYVENHTASAWRILWVYGETDSIIIVSIGPHG